MSNGVKCSIDGLADAIMEGLKPSYRKAALFYIVSIAECL